MSEEILGRLFRALAAEGVRYALFGGLAVAAQGLARATKDVDLFLDDDPANVRAAVRALQSVFADPTSTRSLRRPSRTTAWFVTASATTTSWSI